VRFTVLTFLPQESILSSKLPTNVVIHQTVSEYKEKLSGDCGGGGGGEDVKTYLINCYNRTYIFIIYILLSLTFESIPTRVERDLSERSIME